MDIDWCLTCNRRVEGSSLYCSPDCQYGAGPSTSRINSFASLSQEHIPSYIDQPEEDLLYNDDVYDDDAYTHSVEAVSKTNWAGRGSAGIRAWAAEIPLGAHPDLPYYTTAPFCDDSSSITSASSTGSSTHRAPNLVRPSRPLPPSLTMTKPELPSATPPRPIHCIQKQLTALASSQSPGSTTRTSILSEDSLPTPTSVYAMPFSNLPGRPFPSISDARAYELAACTKSTSSRNVPPRKGDGKYVIRSHGKPASPYIVSSPQSSLDDEFLSSHHRLATNPVVARRATQAAAHTPMCSSVRKDTQMAAEAVRGRRFSRVAA